MKILSIKKKKEIEDLLIHGYRNKSKGYIILVLAKTKKRNRKSMKRSRAYYQYFFGIELKKDEIIHHRDGNSLNDDIRNLEILSLEEHTSFHHAGKRRKKK